MVDEFSLIQSIQPKEKRHKDLMTGIGDDAAVYRTDHHAEQMICMDTMTEGIHFTSATMKAYDIGWKALAANISDIAAMGGFPDYYLVSVAMPSEWSSEMKEMYRGMEDLGSMFQMDLIGGDTTSSRSGLVITITAVGHAEQGKVFLRSGAKPGDLVFVTGYLGESAAGLALLLKDIDINDQKAKHQLIKSHQRPMPQVEAARLLRGIPSRFAVNDISDGLASEANEIAEASGVTININYQSLPVSKSLSQLDAHDQRRFMLSGGEDYQLLITAPEENSEVLRDVFMKHGVLLTKIGVVTRGRPEVYLIDKGTKTLLTKSGYNHFKSNKE
ncbi:thiamine-monophosphate kinase [Scopulibacillus daqui]|uniref:Thiamine-monophosphate kinase n=1 Tax=Scopulibacillus daqui TaxID=1469162 RepID=A0ABS2Q510_9BACL|nr:thiamine-monophosphate kinase [Scopulibacillus daqui]